MISRDQWTGENLGLKILLCKFRFNLYFRRSIDKDMFSARFQNDVIETKKMFIRIFVEKVLISSSYILQYDKINKISALRHKKLFETNCEKCNTNIWIHLNVQMMKLFFSQKNIKKPLKIKVVITKRIYNQYI